MFKALTDGTMNLCLARRKHCLTLSVRLFPVMATKCVSEQVYCTVYCVLFMSFPEVTRVPVVHFSDDFFPESLKSKPPSKPT